MYDNLAANIPTGLWIARKWRLPTERVRRSMQS